MFLMYFRSRYPPYSDTKTSMLAALTRKRRGFPTKYLSHVIVFGVGVAVALLVNTYFKVTISFQISFF